MSFYVSESIRDSVDLESLGNKNSTKDNQHTDKNSLCFCCTLQDEAVEFKIKSMEVIKEKNIELTFETSITLLEKLFFNKVKSSKIFIGKSKINISVFFVKKVTSSLEGYIVTVAAQTEEEKNV
jgi:hypothetical protein